MSTYLNLLKGKHAPLGREPWSSGYGRRLTFQRSWVRIPALHTGWTFFHIPIFAVKICNVCLKRPKINEKEAGVGPFKKHAPFLSMHMAHLINHFVPTRNHCYRLYVLLTVTLISDRKRLIRYLTM